MSLEQPQGLINTPGVEPGRPIAEVRVERRELQNQLDALHNEHRQIRMQIGSLPRDARELPFLQEQLIQLDVRIDELMQSAAA